MSTRNPSPSLTRLHSAREVCEAYGISEATMWRERRRGMLDEPVHISAARRGWTDEQLAAWRARRQGARR